MRDRTFGYNLAGICLLVCFFIFTLQAQFLDALLSLVAFLQIEGLILAERKERREIDLLLSKRTSDCDSLGGF